MPPVGRSTRRHASSRGAAPARSASLRRADATRRFANADSPNSVAAGRTSTATARRPRADAAGVEAHSASVTARPPSEQSCADAAAARPRLGKSSMSARSRARSSAGGSPRTRPWIGFRYSLPPSSPRLSPEQHDRHRRPPGMSGVSDASSVLDQPDHAEDRRRIDRLAVGLVVEADVAAGDRHVERAARVGDALDGLDELPHDLGPLGVAEVQAVGGADRHGRRRTRRCAPPPRPPASRRGADRGSSSGRCRRSTSPARASCP